MADSKKYLFINTFLSFLFLTVGSLAVLYYVSNTKDSLGSEDASAVFGGKANPFDYPHAGYLLSYNKSGVFESCGMVMIAPDIGLSAAHCVRDNEVSYTGLGNFEINPSENQIVKTFKMNESWDGKTSQNDVMFFQTELGDTNLTQYARVSSPILGCDYEILGYGKTDQQVNSPLDQRRSATICIDSISSSLLSISSPDGGVCFGDSGSGIFKKGTNEVVGITSSIDRVNQGADINNCFVGNTAVAVRLDTSVRGFDTFVDNVRKYGALCVNSVTNSSVQCSGDQICANGQCVGVDTLTYVSDLYEQNAFFLSTDQVLYIGLGLGITAIIILIVVVSKPE